MTGRPSLYTPELADEICRRLAEGESLRAICEPETMPSRESVRRWLRDDEAFRGQYAQAREDQAHHYADECIDIVDSEPDPARARVRFDARRWKASKLLPKVYGDKTLHTGGDGEGAVEIRVTIADAGFEADGPAGA